MKQRSGGTSREHLHREDCPCLRNPVPELSESGPSSRIFPTERERERQRERERENHDLWCSSVRELTKGGPSKSAGGGRVTGSALTLRRFLMSKSGNDGTSPGTGVLVKQLRSQQVYPGLRKAALTYVALAG
jgi:hypothetical protein